MGDTIDNLINESLCSDCIHRGLCMYSDSYRNTVKEIINIIRKGQSWIESVTIRCERYLDDTVTEKEAS